MGLISELDIAWAAGLFEGEGCFSVGSGSRGKVQAALVMNDEDVVRRFAEIVGVGRMHPRPRQYNDGRRKDQWRWDVHNQRDVRRLAELFYPYLGIRRRVKADEVLKVTENWERTSRIYGTHCSRGHPYATQIPGRARRCPICEKAMKEARNAKRDEKS